MADALWSIPAELRELPRWALAGASKAPQCINGATELVPTGVNSPAEWLTWEAALAWAEYHKGLKTSYKSTNGRTITQMGLNVGYMLTESDGFTVIDLDVKNATTHPDQPELWTAPEDLERFESIIRSFDSYTERSRSGAGFHIIVKGSIGKGRKRDGVEVYSQQRFIICTGDVYLDRPVADRQAMLDNMTLQMPTAETTDHALDGEPEPDWALAERASLDTGELGRLFRGDWKGRNYRSHSDADLALLKLLLPHVETPRECWETFRLSVLGKREKAKRQNYARSTMSVAIQHLKNDAEHVAHGKLLAEAMGLTGVQAQERGFFWPVPAHNPSHFRLLRDEQLDQLPALRWLVKGIVPDAGIGAIYGDSGTFKSFLTLDLLAHISNGREWFGRKVRGAPAVYVPFEGQGGVPQRVTAWRLGEAMLQNSDVLMLAAPPPEVVSNVSVIIDPMNLREKADQDKLVATLTEQGWAGGVLCIDTLAQASNGIDENSSEMGEMIGIFRELQSRLGGVILVVHHSGKDQARGMRGWSGLHAAMDFVIECRRKGKAPSAEFILTKVKDGSDGLSYDFTMQTVSLGFDEDGDAITSLTVCPTPKPESSEAAGDGAGAAPTKKGIKEISPETAAADDQFIYAWAKEQVLQGKYPSKNSLKSQLPAMKAEYEITQDRIFGAIERLIAASGLKVMEKSPNGNPWLRPVEQSPGAGLGAGVP